MSDEYCTGCGVQITYENEKDIGYKHPNAKEPLCQRCYEMLHFNKVPDTYLQNEQYEQLFMDIVESDNLIVWVIDIFDFNGSYHKFIANHLEGRPILVIANKMDVLPKSVKPDKIKSWIKSSLDKRLKIVDIVVTSAIKKHNIDEIVEKIYLIGAQRAYFVGTTNVGKSTIINKLIRSIDSSQKEKLTTSYYAGTTLGIVSIELSPKLTIYDTPGIINETQVTHYLTEESLKVIIPKNELRPTTFQLQSNQTLFVTGLAQIDYVSGPSVSFTVYASNRIDVHRTNTKNAERVRENHLGNSLLNVPTKMELSNLSNFVIKEYTLNSNKDIFISGLCFIAIKNVTEEIKVRVVIPDHINVDIRENLI